MAGRDVAHNFKAWVRDQLMLLPPGISAWLTQAIWRLSRLPRFPRCDSLINEYKNAA